MPSLAHAVLTVEHCLCMHRQACSAQLTVHVALTLFVAAQAFESPSFGAQAWSPQVPLQQHPNLDPFSLTHSPLLQPLPAPPKLHREQSEIRDQSQNLIGTTMLLSHRHS